MRSRSLRLCLVALAFSWLGAPASAQWLEEARLEASPGAAGDQFGECLALSGTTLLVGAGYSDVGGVTDAGAVFVFDHDGTSWSQTTVLTLPEPQPEGFLGRALALEGDLAVVGAFHTGQASLPARAAAVFRRTAGSWHLEGTLLPPGDLVEPGAKFGSAIDISGDTVILGAKRDLGMGSAFVFRRVGSAWTLETKLRAQVDPDSRFGDSVAIDGDRAVVGAPNDSEGSVWIFERSGAQWSPAGRLPYLGLIGDSFGVSVDVEGDLIAVGANHADTVVANNTGAVLVYRKAPAGWVKEDTLLPAGLRQGDQLGQSVSLEGDTCVAGSWADALAAGQNGHSNLGQGAAYVFTRSGTAWTETQKLAASTPANGDRFGYAVDLEGDLLVAGAPREDLAAGADGGAAYVFRAGAAASCASCSRYCEAGASPAGCAPLLSGWNRPGAPDPDRLELVCTGLEPGARSVFLLGVAGRTAVPFAGGRGLACLVAPSLAGGPRGAVPGAGACGATLAVGLDELLGARPSSAWPGLVVQVQLWVLQPGGSAPLASDALEVQLAP